MRRKLQLGMPQDAGIIPAKVPKVFQTFNSLGGGKKCIYCNNIIGHIGFDEHESNCKILKDFWESVG